MSENEFTGKTKEEAIQEALRVLQITEEEAEIEVLEEGKKKTIFSKGVDARVKVTKKLTEVEKAARFLEGLFPLMKINATTEIVEDSENLCINILTANSYAVIGHRGEQLNAMQVLAGAVANIGREEYERVVVDCDGYREKRKQTLERLALKTAEKAVQYRRKMPLEPMTPYERRIIHSALADNGEVKTVSEGKEPNRFIVIIPNNLREDRGGRSYGRDRRDSGNRKYNNGYGGKDGRNDRGERRDKSDRYSRDGGKGRGQRDDRDRRNGYNGSRSGGYGKRREDGGRNYGNDRPVKKSTPYFGTYLGNSGNTNPDKDEDTKE